MENMYFCDNNLDFLMKISSNQFHLEKTSL